MSDKLELSLEDLGLTQKDQEKVKKCCCVSCVYDKAADELGTADQITINIPGTTTSIVNQKQKAKTKRRKGVGSNPHIILFLSLFLFLKIRYLFHIKQCLVLFLLYFPF